jgi:hypothetical protein
MTRTRISDLLSINPRFFRSVNLERDFGDPLALDGYVATAETSRYLARIGRGLRPESGERAWRITGDFGSGKSSFALVLANLLGRPSPDLPKGIRPLRQELGLGSKLPRLLPVLVTGAREPISFAVLRGLHAAMIRFVDGRKKLHAKDRVGEILSHGTAEDREVIELIEKSAAELVSKDLYDGIVLIIDELGKSLEFAALHPEKQDIYFLQTLAESSSRSGSAPVYTLGLLHQGFAEYAEKLTSTAQLEWAKVSERFSEIAFSQPLGQVSTLIASALSLTDDGTTLWGWKKRATKDMAEAVELGMFGPSPGKTHLTQTAPELYPLHSTVIPVLTRFFRRFGQNERSLFSFLLSSEPFALQDFATNDASPDTVYRLSDFYNYAANNFAHRLSGQSFRSHWNHIDARIRSEENQPEQIQNLLKTIGILNVVSSAELYPTEELLSLALGHPDDLRKSLNKLTSRGVIFNRGKAGYSLWPHASVNLEQRFQEAREKHTQASRIASVVREKLDSRPVVARRHYICTGNLRHFDIRFLTAAEFSVEASVIIPMHPADGTISVVLCESASERNAAIETAESLGKDDAQLLAAISAPLDILATSALELERWEWVERHTPELKDDRFAAEEVSRQVAACRQLLEGKLQELVGFRGESTTRNGDPQITWFYQGTAQHQIGREKNLQSFLSDLCDRLFQKAPQVRNELVNRHAISSAAAAARQKLFKAMLEDSSKARLGLPEDKAPPEKSMYLSVLKEGGLHIDGEEGWKIAFPEPGRKSDRLNLRPALDAIMAHLEKVPDRRVPVGELYDLLRSRPYGVRDGLIPILLLTVFTVHETEVAIYEDGVFQPDTEEFLLMRFARVPKTFEFQLCRINGIRRALITELANVMQAEHAEQGKILSIVRPLCLFVDGLPDYVKNTDQLSPETLALRKAIETAREPSKLVFHAIPEAFGFSGKSKKDLAPTELAAKLGDSLLELRRCYPELHSRMSKAITDAFETDLSLETWRTSISPSAETILVGLSDQELRAFSLKLVDDATPETEWLEALGSMLVRCPPSRWKDRNELAFCERVRALSAQFNRVLATCFDKNGSLPDTAIRVAVTPRNGEEKDLVVNLSPSQARDAEKLRQSIKNLLPSGSQVSLAALSQVLWDILKQSK